MEYKDIAKKRPPQPECKHFRVFNSGIKYSDMSKVLCPDCGKLVKNER